MIYISKKENRFGQQTSALPRRGLEQDPTLTDVVRIGAEEAYVGDGTAIQDVRAGFVAAEIGADTAAKGNIQYESYLTAKQFGLLPAILNYDEDLENRPLSQEEYEQSPFFREELKYMDGMTTLAASVRANTYDAQRRRQDILSRRPGFMTGAAGFIGGLAGGLVETKNLVVSAAVGGTLTAASVGLGAPLAPFVSGGTYAARALRTGMRGYRAVRTARPITTAVGKSVLLGGVSTIPVAVTGLQNEPIFATDYNFDDALIDIAASSILEGVFTGAGSVIKRELFNRNATTKDRQAIAELVTAQIQNGEAPNVDPLAQAVILRNPPQYSSVNFIDEIPRVVKQGNTWVAEFEGESGLMKGTQGEAKTKAEAVRDLRTKYMAENNLPDKIVDSTGATAARELRDLAIARAKLGERAYVADVDEAMAAEGVPLSPQSQAIRNDYLQAEQGVMNAQERLATRPDSIKRRTEFQNAKSRRDTYARRLEASIRENDQGIANRIDSIKAQRQSVIDQGVAEANARIRQRTEQDLVQYAEQQTSPEARTAASQLISTESFSLLDEQARQLRAIIKDKDALSADLERRRAEADQMIDELVANAETPRRQVEFLVQARKDIDGLKSLRERLMRLHGQLADRPYQNQTAFDPDDRFFSTYEDLVTQVEARTEVVPTTNPNEYMRELLDSVLEFNLSDIQLREVQIVNTYRARQQQTTVFNGFVATGKSPDDAFNMTIEAAANDLDRSKVTAHNTFSVALEENNLMPFFRNLANGKNANTIRKVLEELRNINSGGTTPVTDLPDAFKTAEIFKTIYDGYRWRGYDAGLRVRDLEGFIINQSWYKGSLMLNAGSPDAFAKMMKRPDGTWRIDVERTFERSGVSDAEVESFLKDFYTRRTTRETDSTIMRSEDFFRGVSKSAYGRSMENREIFLRDVEDTLYTIENFAGGNLPWTMIQSTRQLAADVRATELFGAEVLNTHDYVLENAKEIATSKQIENMENTGLNPRSVRYPNTRHMLEVAALANELDDGNPRTAAWVSAFNNTARAVLLQDTIISALPDLVTRGRARSRVMGALTKDVQKRVKRAMESLPQEYHSAAARAVSNANAYATGSMLSHMAGGSKLAKFQNISNWAVNTTMRIGGLEPWTRWNKNREFVFINSVYANMADIKYDDLPTALKQEVLRAGITARQWNSLKNHTAKNPDTDSFILNMENLEKADRDLYSRINNLFTEHVDAAVVTPGVRERSILRQGQSSGSFTGALLALSTNLLSYPVSYMTKQIGREMSFSKTPMGAVTGLALLFTYGTIMGTVSEVLKGAVSGSTYDFAAMDEAQYANLAFRGFVRGGGGGLFGDIINKTFFYGDGPLDVLNLGGPAASIFTGLIDASVGAGSALVEGEPGEAAANIASFLHNKIPFTNMIWTSWFFDNFITYPLLEYLDPDRLDRIEQRWEDKTEGELRAPFVQ